VSQGELLTGRQVELVVAALSLGLPVLALVLGGILGSFTVGWRRGLLLGGVVALLGPLCWAMWLVYGWVIARFGLDSVRALLINLALFALVGVLAGFLLRRTWSRLAAKT